MLALVINVGYEFEQLYDNIFEDSTNGGELTSHCDLGGNQTRATELVKNEMAVDLNIEVGHHY